jgi:hypothetical protein
MKKPILLCAALTSITFISGCASPGEVTATTTPVVTNTPVVATTPVINTLPSGVVVTNFVTSTNFVYTTNLVTTYSTNYVGNTTVTQLASTATALAPVIGATVPQPYGAAAGLVVGLLGILGTVAAGSVAAYQNALKNQHKSTLQSVLIGVENALPGVQKALSDTAASGVVPANTAQSLNTASAVLSAVKSSITSTTNATGTANNLNTQLAAVGAGPTAL